MFSKKKMQDMIGLTLLIGTLFSLALVIIGGTFFLLQNGNLPLQSELVQSDTYQTSIKQLWHNALSFTPVGIIELGLLLLIGTQLLRVAMLTWFYAVSRDFWFTIISGFVLLTLIYSFLWRD